MGAYRPQDRELDSALMTRGRIVVETREAALAEAGDLLIPIANGELDADDIVADLSEVVAGQPVRRSAEDVTVFESVGVAFEDLIVARAACARVREDEGALLGEPS
jgi:ornithine cyclodeaminase